MIKRKALSLVVFLLSFLLCSAGNVYSVPARVETTELLEKAEYREGEISCLNWSAAVLRPGIPENPNFFIFKYFQLKQDQNFREDYLKQQQIILLPGYTLSFKKIVAFPLKESLPLVC